MKVSITRGGGMAGLVTHTTLDTTDLAPDDAAAVYAMVDSVDSTSRGDAVPASTPAAADGPNYDRFTYDINIEDGDRHVHVRAAEPGVSEPLRQLIAVVHHSPARHQQVRPPGVQPG